MAPYRSRREDKPAVAPRTGLVADMVRQFADPYAFLRELVQNGIDAGAAAISVSIAREDGDLAITTVTDDGAGMTPELMEGPLLTLFSSSKEADLTKIGKYGVGFVSVFALEPEEVQVVTWRDGRAYLLRLRVDHRYTIEDAPPRGGSGTSVSLLKRMVAPSFAAHVASARASLRRWCRHAERPIHCRVSGGPVHDGESDPKPPIVATEERIDAPFSVAAAIAVTATIDEEVFVVGPSAGAYLVATAPSAASIDVERSETFAGFYNRGLTLFETTEELAPGLRGIRFKVKSPHLAHTLSRDNVRRDEAFARVLERAQEIVEGSLYRTLKAELGRAAAVAAGGDRVNEYAALLEAALSPSIALRSSEISFPLTDPINGVMAMAELASWLPGGPPLLYATAPDAITEALAREGKPVVRVVHPVIQPALSSIPRSLYPEAARNAYLLVSELPKDAQGEVDRALCEEIKRVLAAAGEAVGRVALGSIEGDASIRTAVVVPDERSPSPSPRLWSTREIEASWRSFRSKHRLLLNLRSEAVRRARALAARDLALAGHLLGRMLLVEGRGPLDPGQNVRLLEFAGEGGAR